MRSAELKKGGVSAGEENAMPRAARLLQLRETAKALGAVVEGARAQRFVTVHFKKQVQGETVINLVIARMEKGVEDRIPVPRVVVEDAKVDSLYGNPLHPYTSALLESLPRVDDDQNEKLATIEGMPPGLLERPECCPFEPRCSFAKDICRNENPPLEELKPGHKVACWVDMNTGELR